MVTSEQPVALHLTKQKTDNPRDYYMTLLEAAVSQVKERFSDLCRGDVAPVLL